ncbi:hypothetical protein [Candidatus Magnetaquiglobus chichijimensis]|uniref:hypothetical protein n=1 Tax=Candidatus Magnetaquiglobus chichijimensis TaxID=3141448 RepID=UPI003B970E5C
MASHLVRIILLRFQDEKPGHGAVCDIGAFQSRPEQHRRCGAVHAQAGLANILAPVFIPDSIFRTKEGCGCRRIQFGHCVENIGDVLGAASAVGGGLQEHAELILLEQDGRMVEDRTKQTCSRSDAVAAQELV